MSLPNIITQDKIVVVLSDGPHHIDRDSSKFLPLREAMKNASITEDEVRAILQPPVTSAVVNNEPVDGSWCDGKLVLRGGKLTYDGWELHENLQTRFLQILEEGLPVTAMANFIARIQENPSKGAQDELYDFLVYTDLTLTEDGYVLAYKAVTPDFKDKRTRTLDNSVGAVVKMPRARVCDDRRKGCDQGLHCGSLEYVAGFGRSDDKCIIVKVDPADVVSVPYDCSCQKMRVAKYEVIAEYKGEMTRSVYGADGSNLIEEKYDSLWDDDYDWDDDYEDSCWDEVEDDDWY